MLFLILLLVQTVPSSCSSYPIAKPNCADHCGHVSIPYPFGIGPGCYHDEWYEIVCNSSVNPPQPFLHRFNVEVIGIDFVDSQKNARAGDAEQLLHIQMAPQNICASASHGGVASLNLSGTPYSFSTKRNVFMASGCSGIVVKDASGASFATCTSVCHNTSGYKSCQLGVGFGCCEAPIGDVMYLDFYQIAVLNDGSSGDNYTQGCNTVASLVYSNFPMISRGTFSDSILKPFTTLEWNAPSDISLHHTEHSNCGFVCVCNEPYAGNPFLPNGCQVDCSVYPWSHHCKKHYIEKLVSILGSSIGIGLVLLLLGSYWFVRLVKKMVLGRHRMKHFKRNGGLLFQQRMSSSEGVVEKTKIFTIEELEKATDNFSEKRILGQGGQGTVYKGMMPDGMIVAIKKSKKVDEPQLQQFVNEVIILSQINHRNVVKLLGCCLETEVPLLVYEFIPNGTLYEYIGGEYGDDHCFKWKMRLQIAMESAFALAYLHSSSSTPIYHRDIKSSNILLDEKYRAKVSDFGISKAVTMDQTHVTTRVQGTFGYLDPEYFQTHRFTEKSDVYSFGVVLVEIITGKRPIRPTESTEEWVSLVSDFILHVKGSLLNNILDSRILNEENKGDLIAVASLARQCLRKNGKRRPTMRQVAKVLEEIMTPDHNGSCSLSSETCREIDFDSIAYVNEMERSELMMNMNMSLPENLVSNSFSIEVQPLLINSF